jgi:hypothetical protein
MDVDIPDVGLELPSVGQVSFVVEDLGAGMRRFDRVFGVDSFDVYELERPFLDEARYRGEDVDNRIDIALGSVGDTSLELVEPVSGPSVHADALAERGTGFHHVAVFDLEEPRATVEALEEAGYPVVQSGEFDGTYYWYFDLRDVTDGLYFEIVTRDRAKPEPHRRYPEDYR